MSESEEVHYHEQTHLDNASFQQPLRLPPSLKNPWQNKTKHKPTSPNKTTNKKPKDKTNQKIQTNSQKHNVIQQKQTKIYDNKQGNKTPPHPPTGQINQS